MKGCRKWQEAAIFVLATNVALTRLWSAGRLRPREPSQKIFRKRTNYQDFAINIRILCDGILTKAQVVRLEWVWAVLQIGVVNNTAVVELSELK